MIPREAPTPDSLEDMELVDLCKAELPYNTSAFAVLVARYEPSVRRTCMRLVGDQSTAEELAQDVFMRVFRYVHRFEGRSSFRTWLFRIVRNVCSARNTKLSRRAELMKTYVSRTVAEPRLEDPSESDATLSQRVQQTLGGLEAIDREVLTLRFVSDLSLQEIADALGLGLSATKMRLYRAEERFKKLFEDPG